MGGLHQWVRFPRIANNVRQLQLTAHVQFLVSVTEHGHHGADDCDSGEWHGFLHKSRGVKQLTA